MGVRIWRRREVQHEGEVTGRGDGEEEVGEEEVGEEGMMSITGHLLTSDLRCKN